MGPGSTADPLAGEVLAGGITISPAVALDIIGAINRLEERCGPVPVGLRVLTLRAHLTRALARVGASTRVVAAQDVLALKADAILDTAEVAKMLNITTDAVRWHCRHGGLKGHRVGGRWMVSLESAEDMKARSASGADNEGGGWDE